MLTLFDAATEERAARAQHRTLQRARRAAQAARDRTWHTRLREAIRDTQTKRCRCRLHPGLTRDELHALGAGCTHPHYICPRLDTIRRRLSA